MKLSTLLSFILLTTVSGHAITFTNDFAISCRGLIKLEAISSFYHPGTYCTDHLTGLDSLPNNHLGATPQYCGRVGPIPASGGVKVKATVVDTDGIYCHSFKNKIAAELKNYTFNTAFYPSTVSPEAIAKLKNELAGKTVPFSIEQKFAFNIGTLLPLYPNMMGETLIMKSSLSDGAHLSHHIKVNSQQAYGVPSLEDSDDLSKINTLKAIIEFNKDREFNGPKKNSAIYFNNLITKLEPTGVKEKDTYAQLLVDYLDFVASKEYTPPFFFDINVGGSGGMKIAEKLYQLNINSQLVQYVILNYPHFILGTSIVANHVFKMTSSMLENAFKHYIAVASASDHHTYHEKNMLRNARKVAGHVLNPNTLNVFGKYPELVSSDLTVLADELLQILK